MIRSICRTSSGLVVFRRNNVSGREQTRLAIARALPPVRVDLSVNTSTTLHTSYNTSWEAASKCVTRWTRTTYLVDIGDLVPLVEANLIVLGHLVPNYQHRTQVTTRYPRLPEHRHVLQSMIRHTRTERPYTRPPPPLPPPDSQRPPQEADWVLKVRAGQEGQEAVVEQPQNQSR